MAHHITQDSLPSSILRQMSPRSEGKGSKFRSIGLPRFLPGHFAYQVRGIRSGTISIGLIQTIRVDSQGQEIKQMVKATVGELA